MNPSVFVSPTAELLLDDMPDCDGDMKPVSEALASYAVTANLNGDDVDIDTALDAVRGMFGTDETTAELDGEEMELDAAFAKLVQCKTAAKDTEPQPTPGVAYKAVRFNMSQVFTWLHGMDGKAMRTATDKVDKMDKRLFEELGTTPCDLIIEIAAQEEAACIAEPDIKALKTVINNLRTAFCAPKARKPRKDEEADDMGEESEADDDMGEEEDEDK